MFCPCPVRPFGLEEADIACVDAIDGACLVGFEEALPVSGAFEVFLVVVLVAEPFGDKSDSEVVIGVFDGSGYGSCVSALLFWDVIYSFPSVEATTP